MKVDKHFSVLLLISAILILSFSSCKKCQDCTGEFDSSYPFKDGNEVTVVSTPVTYMGTIYAVGESFVIVEDEEAPNQGKQFEGTGIVTYTEEICGSGRPYRNQIDQYEKNGWTCE